MLAVFIESLEARPRRLPRYGASGPAARRCRRPPSPLYTDCCPTSWLVNKYGPTEAAIDASNRLVEPDDVVVPLRSGPGVTMTGARLRLRPTPPGVRGELYLGGVQVARGTRRRHGRRPSVSSPTLAPRAVGWYQHRRPRQMELQRRGGVPGPQRLSGQSCAASGSNWARSRACSRRHRVWCTPRLPPSPPRTPAPNRWWDTERRRPSISTR